MIEKLLGMPTGCHTSLEEITAVEKAGRGCKMVIKCILIKLFHHKTKRNLKTTADYYPHHASWMACARNYWDKSWDGYKLLHPGSLCCILPWVSLSLFLSTLPSQSFFLSFRKYDLSEDSGASIHYFRKHRKSVNITSLWVKMGIRQTCLSCSLLYLEKRQMPRHTTARKTGFPGNNNFHIFVSII